MAGGNNMDKRSYDLGASAEAQENFNRVAATLEGLIDQRDADVKAAMAAFQADGVSDQYHAKEQRWNAAANEVRSIIRTLRSSLGQSDEVARNSMGRAQAAVDAIG